VRRVEGDQALLQEGLRALVIGARDLQPAFVDFLLGLDPVELDLRGVVGLDDVLQARVDGLDLNQNLPSLRLLRGDRRGARGGSEEGRREQSEESYKGRLSLRRSDQNPPLGTMADKHALGRRRRHRGTLTGLSDSAQRGRSSEDPC
jgi:hypothetical protein